MLEGEILFDEAKLRTVAPRQVQHQVRSCGTRRRRTDYLEVDEAGGAACELSGVGEVVAVGAGDLRMHGAQYSRTDPR